MKFGLCKPKVTKRKFLF